MFLFISTIDSGAVNYVCLHSLKVVLTSALFSFKASNAERRRERFDDPVAVGIEMGNIRRNGFWTESFRRSKSRKKHYILIKEDTNDR